MALHIVCIESINIREISKRETFLGLNLDSWIVSFLMSAWLLSFQPLYAMGNRKPNEYSKWRQL
ncbi:VirB3 type IV secretion protein [Helicobacter pylori]|nr:VirB3 type IV secretion protein [Helicobacter pylori]